MADVQGCVCVCKTHIARKVLLIGLPGFTFLLRSLWEGSACERAFTCGGAGASR